MKPSSNPKIVIVGANFAGLKAAAALPREFSVRVLDPRPWFEFLPNIHELISGFKTPDMLRLSKEDILNRSGCEYIADKAVQLDPSQKKIVTGSGRTISYDYCLLSVGGEHNTFGIPGADIHAKPFKTANDCYDIGQRLKALAESRKKISIVIVGGGLEGVETLGEVLRKYRNRKGFSVHMVESHSRVLHDAPADMDSEIRKICEPYGVVFHTSETVKRVWKHSVDLTGGTKLPSNLTIWTGGAAAPALLNEAGLLKNGEPWAPVHPTLQTKNHPDIFVAGDAAGFEQPVNKQAYHALDMGKCAAENIRKMIEGKSLVPFKASSKPQLVSFGDLDAYLITKSTVIGGTALGAVKEAVYQLIMAEFDPSGPLSKAYHASGRAAAAAFDIALPMLFSPKSLARLKNVRIIK